jgi:signal transduction histidine kinase
MMLYKEPILRVSHLSKRFGTLPTLQDVNFEIHPGEVVGLAGRSGAGKTVLTMTLAGFTQPTGGEIFFDGERIPLPFKPRPPGMEVIPQQPDLLDNFDIIESVFLGNELGWKVLGDWLTIPNRVRMGRETARILKEMDIHFPSLQEKVRNLSSEQRQLINIARALTRPSRLIIVDDPAPLLSYPYQQKLLELIQSWRAKGIAVLFSSNNLDHLFAVTDRIIALRQGIIGFNRRTDETSREEIVSVLVGIEDRQQLTPAIWALDNYYQAREQAEKLRYQQTLLEKNLAEQDSLNRQLINQLARQIKALDQANLALQDAHRRVLTEREQERKHLAREIHDRVIQDLLSENYHLEEISESEEVMPELKDDLVDVRNRLRALVSDLRQICGNLRPPTIDSLGLGAALQSFTQGWAERTGIRIQLDLDSTHGRLPEAIELSIFRIVQEGLNNVARHAKSSQVKVSLQQTSPRLLLISIADDGVGLPKGFDLAALSSKGHYGLLGVSERVALMGGRLKLQNQTNGGLLLQAEIPHPRGESILDSF